METAVLYVKIVWAHFKLALTTYAKPAIGYFVDIRGEFISSAISLNAELKPNYKNPVRRMST
jgi:hypothetical protein